MSAAIALSERVLGGGKKELDAYLGFFSGGCSQDPLDLLRDGGRRHGAARAGRYDAGPLCQAGGGAG